MDSLNSTFLKACAKESVPYTPIWLMRQAGRYLPEYRKIRETSHMLELCRNPELVTEVTLQPLRRFPLDSAILFSDITIPFIGMGVPFDLKPGTGPVLEIPIRSQRAVDELRSFSTASDLPFIAESIQLLKRELKVPLVGFSGAPFTLAAYLVEGRPSRDFRTLRRLMVTDRSLWDSLAEKLVDACVDFLSEQVRAGVDALQVFDSWVGGLSPAMYGEYVLPHMRRLFVALKPLGVPVIHFGTGTFAILNLMKEAGGDVIGLDSSTDFTQGWKAVGYDSAVQGNLDPSLLFAPREVIKPHVDAILSGARGHHGHIFNLGHGVLPETPIDTISWLVDYVHERTAV